ncbi:uncharacterized protein LOC127566078 [Drosophila albomicans]|uniref:Uncharacterized protein LOC127566078 n=1 Tax=Drosophila albomicans TaxID=7291 RepID=A0A9C6WIE8_DROAB|nr:uncharacterized protein LOC127566078 [Drosophila albomicans]
MANYKYHLLQAEGETPFVSRRPLKVCAIFGLILLIIWYNCSITFTIPLTSTLQTLSKINSEEISTAYPSSIQSTSQAHYEIINEETTSDFPEATTSYSPKETTSDYPSETTDITTSTTQLVTSTTTDPHLGEYFVYTPTCHMPAINPFARDALKIFKKAAYKSCDNDKDMISVRYDETERIYSLHMNVANISCCYKSILRYGAGNNAEKSYKLSVCVDFQQDFKVPLDVDGIITNCRKLNTTKVVQKDAFNFVQAKKSNLNKTIEKDLSQRRPSVLLWGIDSLSRMNFQRTMPQMFKYLREENWYELQGYNKMGDNTYPNLMAILTGFNSTRAYSVCKPKELWGMTNCPIIWKEYKRCGYFTAYAEDWAWGATFNFNKKGFVTPPTDYYARTFMLAIEKELKRKVASNIPYCVGRRHSAEYIYDAALQFTKVYRNESSFGMFWTNSFSHNDFAMPSSMDTRMLEYMRSLNQSGVFDSSIIVFFSDHGMRFGRLRALKSGYLEERMPLMYIWLPHWFRLQYPQFERSLQRNRNRLTSPYDIHATLQHILQLETPPDKLPHPEGCASCHSVLHEVNVSRSCRDAGIDDHWCTCSGMLNVSQSDTVIEEAANQLVNATNDYLIAKHFGNLCQQLKLSRILSAQRINKATKKDLEYYLIRYEVKTKRTKATFEATTSWSKKTNRVQIEVPDISRLDEYNNLAQCLKDAVARKYCICRR